MSDDEVLGPKHHLGRARRRGPERPVEAQRRPGLRHVDPVEPREPGLVLVHLPVLALAAIRLDERLLARDLRIPRLGVPAQARVAGLALAGVRRVVAAEGRQAPVAKLPHARHRRVEEGTVVRGHEQRTGAAPQGLLQPLDRAEVKVVGGLVEEEQVRVGDQQAGERGARLLAAGELLR